jgi:hypothetical protein
MLVECAGEDGSEVKCAVRLGETGNPDLSGEGRRCGKVIKQPSATNIRHHLRCHAIHDENSPYVKAAVSPTVINFAGDARVQRRATQQLDFMCVYAQALARCQDELFTEVVDTLRSRATLRARVVEHAKHRLDQCLTTCVGIVSSLAFDGGTIYNRYLAVVLCPQKKKPLVLRFASIGEMGGSMTHTKVAEVLLACVDRCAAVGVPVVGLVADNAANLQATNRCFEGLLMLRCAAHSLQLAVNDAFNDPAVKEIMDLALRIREQQGWEYPVVTRWNSKYDLLCRVWLGKAVVTPTFNDKTLGSLKMLTDALSPFASATDAVQSDRATVFDWATIFAQLSKIEAKSRFAKILRQCFLQRHDKLLSDALLLCCFFLPSFRRHTAEWKSAKTRVRELLLAGGQTMASTVFAAPPGAMASEWQRFVSSPPPLPERDSYTLAEYKRWWNTLDGRFPHLGAFVRAVAQLAPTEASCERAFSAVKFQLGRHRASANPDLVEASVVVTSCCQFEGMEFTESESAESEQDEHVEPPAKAPRTENIEQGEKEKEKEKEKVLTRTDAETIVQAYVVLHDLARVALPPAVDNRLCAKCNREQEAHRGRDGCKCRVCQGWFAFECLPIDADDVVIIQATAEWKCHECESHGH